MRILKTKIVKPKDLSANQKNQMYDVLIRNFEGQTREIFELDLLEKNWVFILIERHSGSIYGFSTLMMLKDRVDGNTVRAFFSGDTIIDKKYWGKHKMFNEWMFFSLYISQKFQNNLYWFLISKGYRTYRLLPRFFNEFYPGYDQKISVSKKNILDAFAYKKFPSEYNKETGIIHFNYDKQRLRMGVGEITEEAIKDPNIAYFAKINPNHMKGDELACLAKIDIDNIKLLNKIPRILVIFFIKIYGWVNFRSLV